MPISLPDGEDQRPLYANFAFHVGFEPVKGQFMPGKDVNPELLGAFAEISGLEAMMEHKVIKAGGRNYGAVLRAGPVTFGTVVLKRGVVKQQVLWRWWALVAGADGATDGRPKPENRGNVLIGLIRAIEEGEKTQARKISVGWRLKNAIPVKFRIGDLNAKGSDVAIEGCISSMKDWK